MVEIQRVWRGYKGRERARDVLRARAATNVKRVWRGWHGRRRTEALRSSAVLVTAVQRRVRGAMVRRTLARRRQRNKTYGAMVRRIQRLAGPWARRALCTRERRRRRLRAEQDAVSLLRQHAVPPGSNGTDGRGDAAAEGGLALEGRAPRLGCRERGDLAGLGDAASSLRLGLPWTSQSSLSRSLAFWAASARTRSTIASSSLRVLVAERRIRCRLT